MGLTEAEALEKYGGQIKIYRYDYHQLDRAKTDREELGKAKFICDKRGRLVGAQILGYHAGDLIHEAQLLKSFKIKLAALQPVIYAYPTYSDLTRQAGKIAYLEQLQNNFFIKILKKLVVKKR